MLEEKDLQAIAQLMKDMEDRLDAKMEAKLAPINDRMEQMQEDISDLRTTVTRVAVTQENIVIPQIKLLAEGHDLLLNTLARKDRVEALEDDVALLKTVIKAMSQRITELEKAQ